MIDSHQHFWTYRAEDYPWMTEEMGVLRRDYLPGDLEPEIASAGVGATVAVQASQTVEETRWLLGLARSTPWLAGVVGWAPLCDPGAGDVLDGLADDRALKGIRHIVQDEPDPEFLLRDDFNRGVAQLARHGLVYDVLIFQRHLATAAAFVDRHPDQPFVVDHLAKPVIHNGKVDPDWLAGMAELARRPNIVGVKISGLVTEVRDPELDPDTLKSYFEEAAALFGANRLMFGSDWPVSLLRAPGYSWWADLVRGFTKAWSADERDAFLGDNAARVYGLEARLASQHSNP